MDFESYRQRCEETFQPIEDIGGLARAAYPIAVDITRDKRVILGRSVCRFFASIAHVNPYSQVALRNTLSGVLNEHVQRGSDIKTIKVEAALKLEFESWDHLKYAKGTGGNKNSNIWYVDEQELREYVKRHTHFEKTLRCSFP